MAAEERRPAGLLVLLLLLVTSGVVAAGWTSLAQVRVRLSHVTPDSAHIQIVKTNSTADQVVVTVTKRGNSSDYRQLQTRLDPRLHSEVLGLSFDRLVHNQEYRVCSSVRRDSEIIASAKCFTLRTLGPRSLTKGVIAGVVAACVLVAVVAILYFLRRVVLKAIHSKTMVVNDKHSRDIGHDNQSATVP